MESFPYELVEKTIEYGQDLGLPYIEARLVDLSINSTILKNGVPELGSLDRSLGIGVRVLREGGMGFSSFNNLTLDSMKKAVDFAAKMAGEIGWRRKTKISFSDENVNVAKYSSKGDQNKRPLDVEPEEKLDLLLNFDKIITEVKTASIPFRFFMSLDETEKKFILTSEGTKIESEIDRVHLYGLITAVNSTTGNMEQVFLQKGKSGGYESYDYWKMEDYIENQVKILSKIVTEAKPAPKGKIDYVLGPSMIGIVCHENQGHPSEADRILGREGAQAGESYLKHEMLGQRLGSEAVTIIDDPTLEGSFGFYLYDDEGVKSKPRFLLKNGLFKDMFHNRESAAFMNTSSTSAARAIGYNREPIARMANTYLEPGDYSKEELIEDIKLGALVINFTEWNIDDRRYHSKYVGLEAYLIENGEVKNLVRRPVIEVTTPKLWGSVDAVAKESYLEFDGVMCGKGEPTQGAPVYCGGTYMRMRDVEVR